MEKFIRQQRSDTNHPRGFPAYLQIIDSFLKWLVGLFQLTEEEQKEAGVRLGKQRYE